MLTEGLVVKNDFIDVWKEIVNTSNKKDCNSYERLFLEKAKEAEDQGRNLDKEVYLLFGALCSLNLDLDAKGKPYKSSILLFYSRSIDIEDFTEYDLKMIKEMINDITDPELQARMGDVLWVRKKDHQAAQIAVYAFQNSFKNLFDPDSWPSCIQRIERAIQLASFLGNNPYITTIELIENSLDKLNGEDPWFLSERLMKILCDKKKGDPSKYILLSDKQAINSEADNKWRKARAYWKISARWSALKKDPETKREKMIRYSETYVKEADQAILQSPPSYIIASSHLSSAIEALRQVENTTDRIKELHQRLIEYQKKSMNELPVITSGPIDISKYIENAETRVSGKNLLEAIVELARICIPPQISILKKQVEKDTKKYFFKYLFRGVALNEEGKIISRKPDIKSDNPEEVEAAVKVEMYEKAKYYQSLCTQGLIESARRQIVLEHNVRIQDFYPIVYDNPFIPSGREEIIYVIYLKPRLLIIHRKK